MSQALDPLPVENPIPANYDDHTLQFFLSLNIETKLDDEGRETYEPCDFSRILGKYFIIDKGVLGIGGFSCVIPITHKMTLIQVALKVSGLKQHEKNKYRNEATILRDIQHPNIIKMYMTVFADKSNFIILERLYGKNMKDYMKEFDYVISQNDVKNFFRQIIGAVYYLHTKKIFHRDIKLENIFVCDTKFVKLIDFGSSVDLSNFKDLFLFEKCGTLAYMSPECIQGSYLPQNNDIWALGVVLYYMLVGKHPFQGENDVITTENVIKGNFSISTYINPDATNLIKRMLTLDPLQRIQMNYILQDIWITSDRTRPMSKATNFTYYNVDVNIIKALASDYPLKPTQIYNSLITNCMNFATMHYKLALLRKQQLIGLSFTNAHSDVYTKVTSNSLERLCVNHDEAEMQGRINPQIVENVLSLPVIPNEKKETFFKKLWKCFNNKKNFVEYDPDKFKSTEKYFLKYTKNVNVIKRRKNLKNIRWSTSRGIENFKFKIYKDLYEMKIFEFITNFKICEDRVQVDYISLKSHGNNIKQGRLMLEMFVDENFYVGTKIKCLKGDKLTYFSKVQDIHRFVDMA